MNHHRTLLPLLLLTSAAPLVAQSEWLALRPGPSRLVSAPGLGALDQQEREYAWGDLDQDGWTDLVAVRKKPFMSSGLRVNVLFMNEGGVLVDRTAPFASQSDVAGDQGFLTPTNDRDVTLVDVDLDGVADIVKNTGIGLTGQTDPRVDVIYNDPANEGFFAILDTAYDGAPYHVGAGDLNRDGRADLDDDGWPEVFIGDMDPIFAGCVRRLKLYHNRAGSVGGFVDLTEESGAGWTGAVGLATSSRAGRRASSRTPAGARATCASAGRSVGSPSSWRARGRAGSSSSTPPSTSFRRRCRRRSSRGTRGTSRPGPGT